MKAAEAQRRSSDDHRAVVALLFFAVWVPIVSCSSPRPRQATVEQLVVRACLRRKAARSF
jgi:hypothetical protein